MQKTHPALLKKWRLQLAVAAWVLSFAFGVLFTPGSRWWLISVAVWLALFLTAYLWYLPARSRGQSYDITEDTVRVLSGVFMRRTRSIPLCRVQFTTRTSSPIDALFNLNSLVVTAPGGRIKIPGLSKDDAKGLEAKIIASHTCTSDNNRE